MIVPFLYALRLLAEAVCVQASRRTCNGCYQWARQGLSGTIGAWIHSSQGALCKCSTVLALASLCFRRAERERWTSRQHGNAN